MTVATCAHVKDLPALPDPGVPDSCPACVMAGLTNWVHLRMFLTCGQIGCCDSSTPRHASNHYEQTGHAVMRSAEKGESWRWCYVDQRIV
jgi:uncharacterized UBP type Zn finger protein